MESSTIIENKNKLISLVQDIVNEYNIMSELKIQKNCESSLEHRRLNDLIRDQEKNTQEQQKLIENFENENKKLKRQLHEYETMIRDLEDKIVSLSEVKEEGNKFGIIKTQADDIFNKDREIERLNRMIVKMKKSDNEKTKIDDILEKVEEKIEVDEVSIQFEEKITESEPSPGGSIHGEEEVEEVEVEVEEVEDEKKEEEVEEEEEEEEEIEGIKFTYRKKDYYYIEGEENNNVYEVNGNDIGNRIGKWVMNNKGKRKVVIDR